MSSEKEVIVATQANGAVKVVYTGTDGDGLPRGSIVTEAADGSRITIGTDVLLYSLFSRPDTADRWTVLVGIDELTAGNVDLVTAGEAENIVAAGSSPCWDGYKQVGFKIKGGKRVPNCVPVDSADASPQESELAASRPAPKKDRIHGSKKNPKGSASGGKTITFSEKTTTALKNKVAEHNKNAPKGRKATLAQLKAVYRRGAGAFSSSHRPGKTRDQWAMARVNAYLKLLRSGRPSNPNYKQDNDLLPRTHPKSSKAKTASAGGNTGYYTPAEQDLARSLVELAETHGKFDLEENGIWVGYQPAAENTDAAIGVKCSNCMLYQSGDTCAILSFKIEDDAKCRFAIFPAGAVQAKNPAPEAVDEIAELFADKEYDESQLLVELGEHEDYASDEDAIFAFAEYSGLGYESIPAFRSAWLRAVESNEEPFGRARELAVKLYDSRDADLLPKVSR